MPTPVVKSAPLLDQSTASSSLGTGSVRSTIPPCHRIADFLVSNDRCIENQSVYRRITYGPSPVVFLASRTRTLRLPMTRFLKFFASSNAQRFGVWWLTGCNSVAVFLSLTVSQFISFRRALGMEVKRTGHADPPASSRSCRIPSHSTGTLSIQLSPKEKRLMEGQNMEGSRQAR
jgi:hypothetical protein